MRKINTNKLKGAIVEKGFTQEQIAKSIGISPRSFYLKMKSGRFGIEECTAIAEKLGLCGERILDIFFAESVS